MKNWVTSYTRLQDFIILFHFFKDSVDSQVRKVHQVSEGNLEDQDPRASLDTQEYLDFQVRLMFKKKKMVWCKSSKEVGIKKAQLNRQLCGGGYRWYESMCWRLFQYVWTVPVEFAQSLRARSISPSDIPACFQVPLNNVVCWSVF